MSASRTDAGSAYLSGDGLQETEHHIAFDGVGFDFGPAVDFGVFQDDQLLVAEEAHQDFRGGGGLGAQVQAAVVIDVFNFGEPGTLGKGMRVGRGVAVGTGPGVTARAGSGVGRGADSLLYCFSFAPG